MIKNYIFPQYCLQNICTYVLEEPTLITDIFWKIEYTTYHAVRTYVITHLIVSITFSEI